MKYTSTVALLAALCLSSGVVSATDGSVESKPEKKINHLDLKTKTRPSQRNDNIKLKLSKDLVNKIQENGGAAKKRVVEKMSSKVDSLASKEALAKLRTVKASSRINSDEPVSALGPLEKTAEGLKRLRVIVHKSTQSKTVQEIKDAEKAVDMIVQKITTQLKESGNCRLNPRVIQAASDDAKAYVKENGLGSLADFEIDAYVEKIKKTGRKVCVEDATKIASGLLNDLKSGDATTTEVITQVVGDLGTRRHARRMLGEAAEVPHPADGSTIELSTEKEEIHFEQDISLAHKGTKVDCFYFEKGDGSHTFQICKSIAYEGSVAAVSMSSLGAGSWIWWTKDKTGVDSQKHSFTVTVKNPSPQESRRGRKLMGEVLEDEWTNGGQILETAGRIYYKAETIVDDEGTIEYPDYACSGTAIVDNKTGRSLIITAAHCVFDDIAGEFGRQAIFIPNRDSIDTALTSNEIHRQCQEDVCGCWSLSAGFVQEEWLSEPWPARLAYDWGIWVADDWGAHQGTKCGSDALDQAVKPFEFEIGADLWGEEVTGLGYSIVHNPDFRYCNAPFTADNNPTEFSEYPDPNVWTWWLPGCGLSGGASGGPWLMDTDPATGTGKIVSVNSWSIAGGPEEDHGMGGPIIDAYSARCLVNAARDADFQEVESWDDGLEGLIVNCYYKECVDSDGQLGEADTYNYYTYDLYTYYDMLEGMARRKLRGGGKGRQLCEEQNK